MAKRIDALPELPGRRRYPWDQWLDGTAWELTRGEDFDTTPEQFRDTAYQFCSRHRTHVRSRIVSPDTICIQALLAG